ncbi:hypothetical protein LTR09_012961 [Extremus antarcticus]|uniref:AB hydrolase-1 domain-containing protein n=1 Tax=Extremus antarcticus TaxID=702011 RepID=A0AAJ0G8U9_9PEZI|nr:hypothetical protein LTR09_012961 [Extremus antarcticus]
MQFQRTPDERFERLSGFPYTPHYFRDGELRMAYIDESTGDGSEVFLCLHGEPTWSYLYRKMIPELLNYTTDSKRTLSRRVIAPDFYGFGRSDKPAKDETYNFDFHRNALLRLIDHLNLTNITLVVQDWGGLIGLTLPMTDPSRFKRLIIMNTTIATGGGRSQDILDWIAYASPTPTPDIADLMAKIGHHLSEDEARGYEAPFPDDSYKGGVRRFPQMIMLDENMPGVETLKRSRLFYGESHVFEQQDVVIVCGVQDRLLGRPAMKGLAGVFKHGCYYAEIEEASHFVQEWGDRVVKLAIQVFENGGNIDGVQQMQPE